MVPKITVGAGLRGALEYDQSSKNGEPRAEWVAGTLIGTPREMAAQAGHFRALRPDCKKPVWRCSISLPPSDGHQTLQKWQEIATDFLREMGIPQNAAWCSIRHFERDHDHIHLTVLRTLPDGSLWNQEHSARRAIKACEKLEQMHSLNTHSRTPTPKDRPSRAEIEISNRKGLPMTREKIQDSVNQILKNHPQGIDFNDLQKLLADQNIDVQPYAPGGVLKGVSYHYDSFKWPGSKIGREFSAGLVARGVRYSESKVKPFAESDSAKETPAPLAGAPAVRQQDRTPQMLRPILQRQHSTNQLRPLGAQVEDDEPQLFKSIRAAQPLTNFAALLKTLALLSIETIKLTAKVAAAVWQFIKNLLALFGIGLREPVLQHYEQSQTEQIAYEPYRLENSAVPRLDHDNQDQAALAVLEVVDALKKGTPESLPAAPGRDELIKTLVEEATKAEADPLAQIFDGTETDFAAPADPVPDPIVSLKRSGTEYIAAVHAMVAARQKPDCGVTTARKKLVEAEREFGAAKAAHEAFKVKNKNKFHIFTPTEKTRLLEAEALVAQAQENLDAAQAKQDSAPAPAVPAAVSARFQSAKAALQKDGLAQVAQLQQEATKIIDPSVKKFAQTGAVDVKAALTLVLQVASPSELERALKTVESTRVGVSARLAEIGHLEWVRIQREGHQAAADSAAEIDVIQRPK